MGSLLKILKLLFGAIAVIALFIAMVSTAITSVPFLTAKHYGPVDAPAAIFKVVLESYDGHNDQIHFICVSWDELQLMERNDQNEYVSRPRAISGDRQPDYYTVYSADLSLPAGKCENIASDFRAEYKDVDNLVVNLQWSQEAAKAQNSYRVDDYSIIPLNSCKFMSAGIAVSVFLVSIMATLMVILFFRFCKKKYGKLISWGFGFALGGFCTLSYAAFNHRMSLDRFVEDPQYFIAASKIAMMIATALFVCTGVSFLLKKIWRPALRTHNSKYSREASRKLVRR